MSVWNNMYDKKDCSKSLLKAADILGKSPTVSEYKEMDISPSVGTIKNKFGWNSLKEELGIETHGTGRNSLSVNHSYFSSVNTTEKAYWLGFLLGDGFIFENQFDSMVIGMNIGDESHVEKFKSEVESEHKITKPAGAFRITFTSDEMANDLAKLGLTDKKTTTSTLPKIPVPLNADFIRGLTDADGTWSKYRWKITGSNKERFSKIQELLPVESHITTRDSGKYFDLVVSSSREVEELREWIYPNGEDSTPVLERKVTDAF